MKTPWDKPRKEETVSQAIKDTRAWLMQTYGGRWGKLQLAAERAEKLEAKIAAQATEIRRLRKMLENA